MKQIWKADIKRNQEVCIVCRRPAQGTYKGAPMCFHCLSEMRQSEIGKSILVVK